MEHFVTLCTCGNEVNILVNRHERTAKRTADLRFSLAARVDSWSMCATSRPHGLKRFLSSTQEGRNICPALP